MKLTLRKMFTDCEVRPLSKPLNVSHFALHTRMVKLSERFDEALEAAGARRIADDYCSGRSHSNVKTRTCGSSAGGDSGTSAARKANASAGKRCSDSA